MKILILKFRNIGDVLLVTPLVQNLIAYHPKAVIDVAVNEGTKEVLLHNPFINEIVSYDRGYIKNLPIILRLINEVKFILQFKKNKYDVVINLTKGDRGAYISLFSGSKTRVGFKNNSFLLNKAFTDFLPNQGFRHTIDTNLDSLSILNVPILKKNVSIYWSNTDNKVVNEELEGVRNFIHIHPVSRWLFKCISDELMSKIVDYCEMKLNIPVIITASSNSSELEKVKKIIKLSKSNPKNLSGKLTLNQVAALNKKAMFFIGVDTAIMHISAANNTPVLSFFGPSGAHHWGPWDNNVYKSGYVKKNGFQSMGIHKVISESRVCQPCGQDGCDGSKISDCLMLFDFDLIKTKIHQMI